MKHKMRWIFGAALFVFVLMLFFLEHHWSAAQEQTGSKYLNDRQNCAQRFSAYVRSPAFMRDIDTHWDELLPDHAKYENIDIAFSENHQPLQHTFLHVTITDRARNLKLYENWFGNIFRADGACKRDFAPIAREFIEYLAHFNMGILYRRSDPDELPRGSRDARAPPAERHGEVVADK